MTAAPDLTDLETLDDLHLGSHWVELCEALGLYRTKQQRGRVYWIGMGSRPEVLRAGLIAYRDAKDDVAREVALLGIVNQYDEDCRKERERHG